MADTSSLGDLVVAVGADLSPFQQSMENLGQTAQQAAGPLNDAFAKIDQNVNNVAQDTGQAAQQMAAMGSQAGAMDSIAVSFQSMAASLEQLRDSVKAATDSMVELSNAEHGAANAAHEMESSFGLMGEALMEFGITILTFEGLKEAAEESVTAFGNEQMAIIALTSVMGGNAEEAEKMIESTKSLANQLGFAYDSFLNAQQRLVALGASTADIPGILTAIADAARAMNEPFDTAASQIERMGNSGTLMARSLSSMSVSMSDIGAAMGEADAPSQQIQADFKAIADSSDRFEVLANAIQTKLPNAANSAADSVQAAWQRVNNTTEDAYIAVGQALGGFASLSGIAGTIIKGVADVVLEFIGIVKQAVDVLMGLGGAITASLGSLANWAGDMMKGNIQAAANDVSGIAVQIKQIWGETTSAMAKDWADTTASIEKLWGSTTTNVNANTRTVAVTNHDALDQLAKDAEAAQKSIEQMTTQASKLALADQKLLNDAADSLSTFTQKMGTGAGEWDKYKKAVEGLQTAYDKLMAFYPLLTDQQKQEAARIQQTITNYQAWQKQLTDVVNGPIVQIPMYFKNAAEAAKEITTDTDAWAMPLAISVDSLTKSNSLMLDLGVQAKNTKPTIDSLFVGIPAGVIAMQELDAATKDLGITTDAVIGTKLNQDLTALGVLFQHLNDQSAASRTSLEDIGNAITSITSKTAGNVAASQQWLQVLQAMGAPLADQLQVEQNIYAVQLKQAEAHGADANTVTLISEKLAQANIQHAALNQEAQGLANIYNSTLAAIGKAWNDIGIGIADAIVSGQNFGQAFKNVLQNLEKQILEGLIGNAFKSLGAELITQTNLLGNFTKGFNTFFGVSGSADTALKNLGSTMTAFSGTFADSTKQMTDAMSKLGQQMQDFATQTTNNMQQATTQVHSSTTSMLQDFSAIANIVTAIASIITAIEIAHTNTLLTRIEESTRKTWIVTGEQGDSIWFHVKHASGVLDTIMAAIWSPIVPLLTGISADLDQITGDMHATLTAIQTGGIGGSGSGGSGTNLFTAIGTLASTIDMMQHQIDVLNSTTASTSIGISNSVMSLVDAGGSLNTSVTNLTAATSSLTTTAAAAATTATASAIAAVAAASTAAPGSAASLSGVASSLGIPSGGITAPAVGGTLPAPIYQPGPSNGITVQVAVNAQGAVVAGNNGMTQLAAMVGDNVVSKLRTAANLKIY